MSPLEDAQERALCVFAHPDDEILAMGGTLQQMDPCDIVLVTDGAPPWIDDPLAHSAMRRGESRAALALTGAGHRLHFLGFSDQNVAASACALIKTLVPYIKRAISVFTHALEHGHPDHDAVCLAVHAAAHIAQRHDRITECPLYRSEGGALIFSACEGEGSMLAPDIRRRKQDMVACFASQQDFVRRFPADREVFHVVPLRRSVAIKPLLQSYPDGIPSHVSSAQWRHLGVLLEASAP